MKITFGNIILPILMLSTLNGTDTFMFGKKAEKLAEKLAQQTIQAAPDPVKDALLLKEQTGQIFGAENNGRVPKLQPLAWEALKHELEAEDRDPNIKEGDIKPKGGLQAVLEGGNIKRELLEKYKWTTNKIPYVFDGTMTSSKKKTVGDAFKDFETYTCIKFVERTTEVDYLNFRKDRDMCYSHVGRIGGKQDISIGSGCGYKGIAIHEIMHSLGFLHEHTRPDRDQFIKIKWKNIKKGKEGNFKIHNSNIVNDFDVPYDLLSVMHYGRHAFAKMMGLRDTIKAQKHTNFDSDKLGQRLGFSETDLLQIRKAYCGNTANTPAATLPSILAPAAITTTTTTAAPTTTTTTLIPVTTSTTTTTSAPVPVTTSSTTTRTILPSPTTKLVTIKLTTKQRPTIRIIDPDDDDDDNDKPTPTIKISLPILTPEPTPQVAHAPPVAPVTVPTSPLPVTTSTTSRPTVNSGSSARTKAITLVPGETPTKSPTTKEKKTTTEAPKPCCGCLGAPPPAYPCWPTDFVFSNNGIPTNCNCNPSRRNDTCKCNCINMHASNDSKPWSDNYLCYKGREVNPNFRWTIDGDSKNKKCITFKNLNTDGHMENFHLCVNKDAPYNLEWSPSDKTTKRCLTIDEPEDKAWQTGYLCA